MLDKRILRIEEKLARQKLFLPPKVVWREVWIGGFKRRHNYI
jgi:hypothetical protein